jgi:alkanesulfonate monooxygenase SsuD/methylene tetrahydromethanopterin reductase-like flavin-dependent oxidoreductase (luciferase family)
MKYGVYLPPFGPYGDARVLADLARDAEQAGWDGFFLWDHIAPAPDWPKPMVDPWIALTTVALNTQTIRFGPLITPLPRRRPWKYARETVSLDRLSGGRLIAGVGIGLGDQEWDRLGEETDIKTRGAMLDEGLDLLQKLWSGEPFSHEGTYYHVKDMQFLPTSSHIPVWVAAIWPNKVPLRRAAQWDGLFALVFDQSDREIGMFRDSVQYALEQRDKLGLTGPFDVVYAGHPTPGNDPARAAEIVHRYAETGITWWLENIVPFPFGKTLLDEWPLEAMRDRILAGPPRI